MMRLILSDLAAQAKVWAGTLVVTATAGFVASIAAGFLETGRVNGSRIQDFLNGASSMILLFSGVTAFVVLAGTANLAVALQRRSYALWQLVGIRPALVAIVVLTQLGIVALIGSGAGALLAVPVFGALMRWAFRDVTFLAHLTPSLSSPTIALVIGSVVAVTVLGGLRAARRASRTPPIHALRSVETPRVGMGWFRILATLGAATGTISAAVALVRSNDPFTLAMLFTPMIAAVFALAGPLLYPLLLNTWTGLLPAQASATWFFARRTARSHLATSTATIGPLMVGIAIAAGLYTTLATFAEAARKEGNPASFTFTLENFVIILGGPLLLSAIAAAATVFMSGNDRDRELALLQAAGATRRTVLLSALWEATIYAATAALLGTIATVIGGIITATAIGVPTPMISLSTVLLLAGAGFLLLAIATLGPTAGALKRELPRTLAIE